MRLEIHQLPTVDTYRDMARIPEDHRLDPKGRKIPEGSVCKVTINEIQALSTPVRFAKSV